MATGKAILNLDKQDVPLHLTAKVTRKYNAGSFVMVTVHDSGQAKFYYDDDHNRMMLASVKTEAAMKTYEAAGIPWWNMIACIGPESKPENKKMYNCCTIVALCV